MEAEDRSAHHKGAWWVPSQGVTCWEGRHIHKTEREAKFYAGQEIGEKIAKLERERFRLEGS